MILCWASVGRWLRIKLCGIPAMGSTYTRTDESTERIILVQWGIEARDSNAARAGGGCSLDGSMPHCQATSDAPKIVQLCTPESSAQQRVRWK